MKLVVAGPASAGKTTLVRTLADLTVRSTGDDGRAFDLGRITVGRDLVLYLYGAPAEPGPAGWRGLAEGMLGSLLVVDGLRPDGPALAAAHVRWFAAQPAPMLVAANRCPPEAAPVVARELGVAPSTVTALDCKHRPSVKNLVIALLESALDASAPAAVRRV